MPAQKPTSPPVATRKPAASRIFYILGSVLLGIWLLVEFANQNSQVAHQPPIATRSNVTSVPAPESAKMTQESSSIPEATSTPIQVRHASPTDVAEAAQVAISSPTPKLDLQGPALPAESHLPLYALPTPTVVTPPVNSTLRVVGISARDTLNVRTAPGSQYPTVVRLRLGVRGIVLLPGRVANGTTIWQRILVHGYEGWVNELFLAPEGARR